MRPWIGRLTDKLIAAFAQHDRVELMAEFAVPLPILVSSELLGLPETDRPQVRALSRAIISGLGSPDFPAQTATEFRGIPA